MSTGAVLQRSMLMKELEEKWAREKVRILIPVIGARVLHAGFLLLPALVVFAKDVRDGIADGSKSAADKSCATGQAQIEGPYYFGVSVEVD